MSDKLRIKGEERMAESRGQVVQGMGHEAGNKKMSGIKLRSISFKYF
jgi:hypothetical protein